MLKLRSILLVCALYYPFEASSFNLGLGLGGAEEGDDRLRPTAMATLGFNDEVMSNLFIYGRSYGPVVEKTWILSSNYKFSIVGSNSPLYANIGLAGLLEQTTVERDPSLEKPDHQKSQYNAGMSFGVSYEVELTRMFFSLRWDSHVFVAGSAGIFLTTGRKQVISCVSGFYL